MALISPVFTSITMPKAPLSTSYLAMAERMLFSRNICTSLSMVSTRSRPSVAS